MLTDKLEKYQNRIKKSPKQDIEYQSPSGATTPDVVDKTVESMKNDTIQIAKEEEELHKQNEKTEGLKRTAKDKPKGDRVKQEKAGKVKTPREGGRKKRSKSPKESGPASRPPSKLPDKQLTDMSNLDVSGIDNS